MRYNNILFEKKDRVAKITFNRPEAFNAMNDKMILEINGALQNAEKDDKIRVVVLTGTGRAFCVGADLKSVQEKIKGVIAQGEMYRMVGRMITDAVENLGKPVIAALNGYTMAGGFELMLACDFVIAAENAVITDQHINVGLIGPGGSTQRIARVVGIRRAKELILTGKRLSGKEAESIGLVNRAVPAEELESAVNELAATLAEKSPIAMRIGKTLLNRSLQTDLKAAQELEIALCMLNTTTEDYEEGMKSFEEKRKPVFKGR